ncbi:MAG: hypothetical protein AAF682_04215 [Planctomycetota bacterium]
MSVGLLAVMSGMTRRQAVATDDRHAFYIAEAGLAESYVNLTVGGTGALGSLEQPALYGGGLVWVDVHEPEEGQHPDIIRLQSTALYGRGRSSLEIVVRRVVRPFGVFTDEDIDLEVPFLVDGYDSDSSSYFHQAGLPTLDLVPGSYVWFEEHGMIFDGSWWYRVESFQPTSAVWLYRFVLDDEPYAEVLDDQGMSKAKKEEIKALVREDGQLSALLDDLSYDPKEVEYLEPAPRADLGGGGGVSGYSYHTDGGGSLGSNGSIKLQSDEGTVEVYGDLMPGVGKDADLGADTSISGTVASRATPLELAPVSVPPVVLLPGFTHNGGVPYVVPAADIGYDFIDIGPNAQLVVQGPGSLVVGDLMLQASSLMTVDNLAGAVNFYVTGSADLALGSQVQVLGDAPQNLSFQVAGDAGPILLNSTSDFYGMVYGPEAEISIGAGFELFGTLAARRLNVDPYTKLHFDSGILGDSGSVPLPRFIGWTIEDLPRVVVNRDADPYSMLGLDQTGREGLGDQTESDSWWLTAEHFVDRASHDLTGVYEGPAEDWGAQATGHWHIDELVPPKTDENKWSIYAKFMHQDGHVEEYDGPLSGLEGFKGEEVYSWIVTGPDDAK